MVKYAIFILCLSSLARGMEDKNREKFTLIYAKDILPQMPAYTKITPEKGEMVLKQLAEVGFDQEAPQWKFKHAFAWASYNSEKPNKQVDLGILKRFVAMHIDKSENEELGNITQEIIENPDNLRWVVVADASSAVLQMRE